MDIHRATMVGVEPVGDKAQQLEGQTSRVKDGKAAAEGGAAASELFGETWLASLHFHPRKRLAQSIHNIFQPSQHHRDIEYQLLTSEMQSPLDSEALSIVPSSSRRDKWVCTAFLDPREGSSPRYHTLHIYIHLYVLQLPGRFPSEF